MVGLSSFSCIASLLFVAVAAQTTTQLATPTAPGDIACNAYPTKYYPTRTLCTPAPGLPDDAVSIQAAADKAGKSYGFVVLPEDQTFTIRSPIKFNDCFWCGFRLSGTLKVAGTESDWSGTEGIITVRNSSQVEIYGASDAKRGLIDASDLHFSKDTADVPALFHYNNGPGAIFMRYFDLKNAPKHYFNVHDITKISASDMSILTEADYARPDANGIVIGNSYWVYFNRLNIKFEGEKRIGGCIAVDGVQPSGTTSGNAFTDITCTNANTGVTISFGTSNSPYTIDGTYAAGAIRMTNLVADTEIATGILNPGYAVTNVTTLIYDNVTVLNGEAFAVIDDWVLPGSTASSAEGDVSHTYTDIWLKNFKGNLGAAPQNQTGSTTIDVHIENWSA